MPPGYYYDYPGFGQAFQNTRDLDRMANPGAYGPPQAMGFQGGQGGVSALESANQQFAVNAAATGGEWGGGLQPAATGAMTEGYRERATEGGATTTLSLVEQAKRMGVSLNQLLAMKEGQPPLGYGLAA